MHLAQTTYSVYDWATTPAQSYHKEQITTKTVDQRQKMQVACFSSRCVQDLRLTLGHISFCNKLIISKCTILIINWHTKRFFMFQKQRLPSYLLSILKILQENPFYLFKSFEEAAGLYRIFSNRYTSLVFISSKVFTRQSQKFIIQYYKHYFSTGLFSARISFTFTEVGSCFTCYVVFFLDLI